MSPDELPALLAKLRAYSHETEWVEFKQSNADPKAIGEYLSALSNAAALHQKESGYIIWGIENETHRLVGTNFKPRQTKKGNEELENWLLRSLSPAVDLQMHECMVEGRSVVIFQVAPAHSSPVKFQGTEFIRVGSLKKRLADYPGKAKKLWSVLSAAPFEKGVAKKRVTSNEVLSLIDYTRCFELLGTPLPDNRVGILERLATEKVIHDRGGNRYDVTNLGAVLFAKNLMEFERLSRKALRVIEYKGKNRVETVREQAGNKGYAIGFEGAIGFINNLLPQNEQIEQALRKSVPVYPEIAIRELVANALIHQDFLVTGTGPMVEIFSDRIEVTNPGKPLIEPLRFIDEPPQSRNEDLAALMRRMNICEERGSGVDKVIFQVELFQLPAPDFLVTADHTKAVLFAPRNMTEMDSKDRTRACYQHACLRYVSNEQLTNSSLRKRFGIDEKNYAKASRIIRDTVEAGLVRAVDPTTSKRYMKYVPFWA